VHVSIILLVSLCSSKLLDLVIAANGAESMFLMWEESNNNNNLTCKAPVCAKKDFSGESSKDVHETF